MHNLFASLILALLALPCVYGLTSVVGWKRAGALFVVLCLGAIGIEYIALTTGFPYGAFVYTGPAGYLIAGVVPSAIGLAWAPLVIGSYLMGQRLSPSSSLRALVVALCILVLTDMVLDPGAVAVGLWRYAHQDLYGVPWTNFAGWVLTGSIGICITHLILRSGHVSKKWTTRNQRLCTAPFFATILIWTLVDSYHGLWISVVIGIASASTVVRCMWYMDVS